MNLTYATNVVDAKTLHTVQGNVLLTLSNILSNSFGPSGSTTIIKKPNIETMYSKDGHTILSNVHFNGIIEEDIKENIETITRQVVKTVGDGTTSAVILSHYIFDELMKLSNEYNSSEIRTAINTVTKNIKDLILSKGKECTVDDIYDICMVSTNGNEDLSKEIYHVYKEYGTEVFIDVSPSLSEETYVKVYDGMVINTGLSDSYYVNTDKNTCVIDHPEVYFFEHPIDTKEMSIYLDAIIERNILNPLKEYNQSKGQIDLNYIPTVILAPKLSRDLSSYMDSLVASMEQAAPANRPPLLIITDMHQVEELYDVADLCGAKQIRKYIDSAIYLQDKEKGYAPGPETISMWAGHCQRVESDTLKTKFVNPELMWNDDNSHSDLFNNRLDFLEKELKAAKERGDDAHTTGTLKRRINSLKSNMVEIFVGGISSSDRDAVRDLVEDAVLNCRSACNYGVGYGANFNALLSISEIYNGIEDSAVNKLANVFYSCYTRVIRDLYKNVYNTHDSDYINKLVIESEYKKMPINLRTGEFDGKVKCSIEGDIVILDAISKIIGLMATSNQFILPTPQHNVYVDPIDPTK